jgi:RNA polymerase sigma factor (sigma-70 family)
MRGVTIMDGEFQRDLKAARERDHDAFDRIWDRFCGPTLAFVIISFPSLDDHELATVVEQLLLDVTRGRYAHHEFSNSKVFTAWLRTSAYRDCVDATRKQERLHQNETQGSEYLNEFPSKDPGPPEESISLEFCARVFRAICELPHDYAETMILYVFEGMTYRQIAETRNVPIGTVMSHISRARKLLRGLLDFDNLP